MGIYRCLAIKRESAGTCVPSDHVSSPNTAIAAAPSPVPAILPSASASEATCAPTLFMTAMARIDSICAPLRRAAPRASLLAICTITPFSTNNSRMRSAASNTSATGEPGYPVINPIPPSRLPLTISSLPVKMPVPFSNVNRGSINIL